ncbi:MAG: hypothetical protein PHY24_05275, partial [Candidatus Cloacimonetes bacterium]|nr:hypothetical protein [Candidatus Cloacimonadota bacterium]
GISLFAYLGREYRKIFVFQDGEWFMTLPIHINQDYPDNDVIFSKIALALDSAQVGEAESIVLAGDLANQQLINYINFQNVSMNARLLSFPYLTVAQRQDGNEEKDQLLAPYALALALAYKTLNMDNQVFGKCNFLPHRVLDNQKELRMVWHGFIVLTLIFGLVLYTTTNFMGKNQKLRQIQQENTDLTFQLNRLKAENAIIETLTEEINRSKQGLEKLNTLLKGKNRWTETLDQINTVFARYPQSWITNMRQHEDRIAISGITAKREHVSRLAEGLPDGCIRRVTHSKIRNQIIWIFEMDFVFSQIDWEEFIARESVIQQRPQPIASRRRPSAKERPVQEEVQSETYGFRQLPDILPANLPTPDQEELKQDTEFARTFESFMEAIQQGNMMEYRFIGYNLINQYPDSNLLPLTRWWLAYRLYQEKEYTLAEEYLNLNLSQFDRYHPASLLLKARLRFARSNPDFKQYYLTLQNEYPRSRAAHQAALDQQYIQGGRR